MFLKFIVDIGLLFLFNAEIVRDMKFSAWKKNTNSRLATMFEGLVASCHEIHRSLFSSLFLILMMELFLLSHFEIGMNIFYGPDGRTRAYI